MGTLFYTIAYLAGFISEDSDLVNLSFLVSIDSLAIMLFLGLWSCRKKS